MIAELDRLVSLSPPGLGPLNAAVREVCAGTVGLPALPAEPAGGSVDPVVLEFAEQFSVDVTRITADQRAAYADALGAQVFTAALLIFIADFVPRIRAGFASIGVDWTPQPVEWDRSTAPADLVLNAFVPAVGRMRALDPLTTELVRLRGARQHNCRLCRSLREGAALDAGGTESLYDDIDDYEASGLSDRHKAALRHVDQMIWTPAAVNGEALRANFSPGEAVELTLDVMRNATNKVAVALGADAPRVEAGTERYELGADGQPVYS